MGKANGGDIDLRVIILEWLSINNYEGLYNDGQCACRLSELMPCDEPDLNNCHPGFVVPCDGTCDMGKCNFHVISVVDS
jgi:hypothetical protein